MIKLLFICLLKKYYFLGSKKKILIGIYQGFSHVSKFQELVKSLYLKLKINYIRTYGFLSNEGIITAFMGSIFYSHFFLKRLTQGSIINLLSIRPVGDVLKSSLWIDNGKKINRSDNWYLQPMDSDGV